MTITVGTLDRQIVKFEIAEIFVNIPVISNITLKLR